MIPEGMGDLHVTIGERVNETYCLPKPKSVGTFCGGPFVKSPQQNPRGGHPPFPKGKWGPYWFHQSGALLGITGLTVRANGLLLGTVRGGSAYFEDHIAHTYNIQICVSDVHIIPRPGDSSATCRNAKITVVKKANPYPYDGTWTGQLDMTVTTAWYDYPYPERTLLVYMDAKAVISHGQLQSLGGGELDPDNHIYGWSFTVDNDNTEPAHPQIPADGLVTDLRLFLANDGALGTVFGSSLDPPCTFAMQFQKSGEAGNVADISCTGTDISDTPATFTGGIALGLP
jgi:hypothetical protein